MTTTNTEIVDFFRKEAGDYLRSILFFDGQEYEVAYIRDDVADEYLEKDRERIVASLLAEAAGRNQEEELYVHGELNCIVRSFDQALEVHVPQGTYSGTSVALDIAAARDLSDLIVSILEWTAFDEPGEADEDNGP